MIGQTLAVAFVFGMLALSRRSTGSALGVIIMSMMLWPEYLRVPMGWAQMSVPRMLALALLLQFMGRGRHRGINLGKADFLILAIWMWSILATTLAGSQTSQVTVMIGRGFDTVLMYFVARIAIRKPEDIRGLCTCLMVTAIAMGIVGLVETTTTRSPYSAMSNYMTWSSEFNKGDEFRLGLLRARGSTAVHIYFGMAMMVVLGMLWALRGYADRPLLHKISISAALIGGLSSMSSGPWLAIILAIAFNAFAGRVGLIRPTTYLILLACIAMEVLSNRHFYHLIDYLALDSATAWYRTRLLEVAISQWRDFWIIGVGSSYPHHWAALVDGREHIDIVNHFLVIGLQGGIPAVYLYIWVHVTAVRSAAEAWRSDADEARRKLLFGMAATLIALDIASMSVGLFGPVLLLSHILLGCTLSLAVAWVEDDDVELPSVGETTGPASNGDTSIPPSNRDWRAYGRIVSVVDFFNVDRVWARDRAPNCLPAQEVSAWISRS